MLMIVDLPAPFSPITPWMVPAGTDSDTSRLAWLVPNHLLIATVSRAIGALSCVMKRPLTAGTA